jgi:hypothetical protein
MATPHPRTTGRKSGTKSNSGPPEPEEFDSFSLMRWCRRNSISRATFYRWQKLGLAPRVIRVRGKNLITKQDDLAWREARRAESIAAE